MRDGDDKPGCSSFVVEGFCIMKMDYNKNENRDVKPKIFPSSTMLTTSKVINYANLSDTGVIIEIVKLNLV